MALEEAFVDFKCPYCGELTTFPHESVGTAQECPTCGECLVVPGQQGEAGRKLPLPISTSRLCLRRFHADDWKDLRELHSDEDLFQYLEIQPLAEEEILRWLDSDCHVRLTTPNTTFHLGMELKEGGQLIGYVSLRFIDAFRHQMSLSVVLGRGHQRHGYAREAVRAALDFCFRGINLHRVAAACDGGNVAALRLFESAGFRREGEFRQDRYVGGQWADSIHYGLLRMEYLGRETGQ